MKNLLPLIVLLLVVLGCVAPRTKTDEQKDRPKITISKPVCESEYGYTTMNFEVTNVSLKRLEFLKVEASFYDKSGTLIDSETMYPAGTKSLEPGERVAAKIMTQSDKRFSTYNFKFTANGDAPFEQVTVDAEQLDPPKAEPKKKKAK